MADERLLPAGIRDERTRALLELLDRVDDLDLARLLVYRIADVDASALPHLGWQFHVMGIEGWDACQTDEERRALLLRAIELHRFKGTPWAVKEAIKAVGYLSAEIEEGRPVILYDGARTHSGAEDFGGGSRWALFKVLLDLGEGKGLTAGQVSRIQDLIEAYKNARSHLRELVFRSTISDSLEVVEETVSRVLPTFRDVRPWGLRYDGAARHDDALRHLHDGTATHAGGWAHDGWTLRAGAHRHDNIWDAAAAEVSVTANDQPGVTLTADGRFSYGDGMTHGEGGPSIADPRQDIIDLAPRYDGRHPHAGIQHGAHRRVVGNQAMAGRLAASDVADIADGHLTAAGAVEARDVLPWGRRHDGSLTHDQGARVLHDGARRHDGADIHAGWRLEREMHHGHAGNLLYDGAALHVGWTEEGAPYGAQADAMAADVALGLGADRVRVDPLHDGRFLYSGFTYGQDRPAAVDPAMDMRLTRYFRHNGRRRHGGDLYDGSLLHGGEHPYFAGILHAGSATHEHRVM